MSLRSMRGHLFAIIAAIAVQSLLHGQSKIPEVSVRFVGCESDGQAGPRDAPKRSAAPVPISEATAQSLAYYKAGEGFGILAPRGWHCFYVYGSGGSILILRPEPIDWNIVQSEQLFVGPLVAVHHNYGGTSGREQVAEAIAQAFPSYRYFVDNVKAMFEFLTFPSGPKKTDKLTYKSPTVVEYQTPAQTDGLGIGGLIQPGIDPISGLAILTGQPNDPYEEIDLILLVVHLPANLRAFAPTIIQQLEREAASLPTPSPPAPPPSR